MRLRASRRGAGMLEISGINNTVVVTTPLACDHVPVTRARDSIPSKRVTKICRRRRRQDVNGKAQTHLFREPHQLAQVLNRLEN